MEEASSLFSFFFYVLFVYPATTWILKKQRGLTYAITLLVAIAAVKTGFELRDKKNYYQLLEVTRGSSPLDIKRAYKRLAVLFHPDKNPSESAVDDFAKVKAAYDVLMDTELKDVYYRFGEDGIKQNKRIDEYRMLLEIGVFYVAWGVMAFLLTLGKSSQLARQWTFTGLVCMLVIEVMLMLQEFTLPDWFLPSYTAHDIIVLLHNLFPAYLNGCRCIGGFLYVDLDEHTKQLLLALYQQNKDILQALSNLPNRPQTPVTPAQKLKDLEVTLRGGTPNQHPATNLLKSADSNKSNMGLYLMIAAYVALYYCFAGNNSH